MGTTKTTSRFGDLIAVASFSQQRGRYFKYERPCDLNFSSRNEVSVIWCNNYNMGTTKTTSRFGDLIAVASFSQQRGRNFKYERPCDLNFSSRNEVSVIWCNNYNMGTTKTTSRFGDLIAVASFSQQRGRNFKYERPCDLNFSSRNEVSVIWCNNYNMGTTMITSRFWDLIAVASFSQQRGRYFKYERPCDLNFSSRNEVSVIWCNNYNMGTTKTTNRFGDLIAVASFSQQRGRNFKYERPCDLNFSSRNEVSVIWCNNYNMGTTKTTSRFGDLIAVASFSQQRGRYFKYERPCDLNFSSRNEVSVIWCNNYNMGTTKTTSRFGDLRAVASFSQQRGRYFKYERPCDLNFSSRNEVSVIWCNNYNMGTTKTTNRFGDLIAVASFSQQRGRYFKYERPCDLNFSSRNEVSVIWCNNYNMGTTKTTNRFTDPRSPHGKSLYDLALLLSNRISVIHGSRIN